jgi:hypothetical protein
VKPRNTMTPFITKLTSIINEDVATAESFPAAGKAFIQFMQQHANKYEEQLLENPLMKKVMSSWKFFNILCYLHFFLFA